MTPHWTVCHCQDSPKGSKRPNHSYRHTRAFLNLFHLQLLNSLRSTNICAWEVDPLSGPLNCCNHAAATYTGRGMHRHVSKTEYLTTFSYPAMGRRFWIRETRYTNHEKLNKSLISLNIKRGMARRRFRPTRHPAFGSVKSIKPWHHKHWSRKPFFTSYLFVYRLLI